MNNKRLFTMGNKIALFLLCMLFLVGCAQKEAVGDSDQAVQGSNAEIQEPVQQVKEKTTPPLSTQGLGELCYGEEECLDFCLNNREQCEEYCKGNSENELCKIIFPPKEEREQIEKPQEMKPVLKNLGINIHPWDKKTNLAGDLIFDKRVIYDDGRVHNDRVFLDFGYKDKYRKELVGSIEYWFFVPLGTDVYAPIDGTVQIGFFEHTQDWGISFYPGEGSNWIVSFEHVINPVVEEGEQVHAGDIVAEAGPRISKGIAMVELAVWRPSRDHIFKYCPFEFLDESLKPIYEEKINRLAKDWEEFIGKDVYKQEDWIAPGCLLQNITER